MTGLADNYAFGNGGEIVNHGLYTDTVWAVPVTFKDTAGNLINLTGHQYVADVFSNGVNKFTFRSSGASVTEGTLGLANAATGVISFNATITQHAGVKAGIYRLHLKRDLGEGAWFSEGTILIGDPGAVETYLLFDDPGADSAAAITYAQQAAGSAAAASGSATAASGSATAAASSAAASSSSATAASASATNAAASQSAAGSSATAASGSASTATSQATSASTSASTATTQATTATTKAGEAAGSATAAASSATAASGSATAAATSATNAANSATASSTSASTATTQATNAATSATSASGNAAAVALQTQNAQAAASLAQGYAASASSVIQQDLSGITSQALHRSPNAITAQFIYDTSKDSDGGAWTEKCQGTSWYNEALAGKWLGPQISELYARNEGATFGGTDLVVNGNFASGTGWTGQAGWVISGGTANGTAVTGYLYQNTASVVVNRFYEITFTISNYVSGSVRSYLGATPVLGAAVSANGTYTQRFSPTINGGELGVTGSTFTGSIDNVSVREVTALNTASNDYFQLTTDGKFYRLWKNHLQHSSDFAQSAWNKVNATIAAATAPDGTSTAVTLTGTGAGGSGLRQDPAVSSATVNVSYYVKAGTATSCTIGDANIGAVGVFNLSSVTASGSGSIITDAGGGWYRCSITYTAIGGFARQTISPGSTFFGTTTSSIVVWNAQVELGSTATTYEAKTTQGTTSEIFRGNKADFPKLSAIVAEATSVNIYDLTEPGRPMWMRFTKPVADNILSFLSHASSPVTSVAAMNGAIAVGQSNSYSVGYYGHLRVANFSSDQMRKWAGYYGVNYISPVGIAERNNTTVGFNLTYEVAAVSPSINSGYINAVAMTVLPDAPIDPATSLRVPTIAVATAGGVSVIKHDGSVVNIVNGDGANDARYVGFTRDNRIITQVFDDNRGLRVFDIPNANVTQGNHYSKGFASEWYTDYWGTGSNHDLVMVGVNTGPSSAAQLVSLIGNRFVRAQQGYSDIVNIVSRNRSTPTKSLLSTLSSKYNTGWLTGDIRRAYLSDVTAESISGSELVTNGTFASNVSGWTALNGGSIAWSSGAAVVTGAGANTTGVYQPITCVIGKTYRFQATCTLGTATIAEVAVNASAAGSGGSLGTTYGYLSSSQTFVAYFVATATTHSVVLMARGVGLTATFDNVTVTEAVLDRSYKAASAPVFGTLAKSQLASGTSLVGFSGYSGSNYLREPYSADLDFGTGEWNASAWVNVPATLPAYSTVALGPELVTNGTFDSSTGWSLGSGWSITGGQLVGTSVAGYAFSSFANTAILPYRVYKLSFNCTVTSGDLGFGTGNGGQNIDLVSATGSYTRYIVATQATSSEVYFRGNATFTGTIDNVSLKELILYSIADRAFSSGPRIRLTVDNSGRFTAEAFDGTTTRTVTTTAAYNTATWLKADANYTTDGSLTIRVNGREVAATRGNPLLALNNTSAVLTIGNNYTLDGPFPGTIALLKLGATVPTNEQSQFMYEQEKQMFRANAQSVLPDAGSIVDMAYDDATDRWVAVSAANESYWTGLVRNKVVAVPAGSYTKIVATSGIELAARSTTNPGVDVTIPAYGLREELVKRSEAAARLGKELSTFDYVGGFTANTTSGSTAITVTGSGITYPASYIGARISGSGIPANTTIVAVSGTTLYLSAAATATATTVSITFLDFALPMGMETKTVMSAGSVKQEGSTKDYTRLYDGFMETIRFAAAPGVTTWVQVQAQRISQ